MRSFFFSILSRLKSLISFVLVEPQYFVSSLGELSLDSLGVLSGPISGQNLKCFEIPINHRRQDTWSKSHLTVLCI